VVGIGPVELHMNGALLGEFDGITNQVDQNLLNALRITPEKADTGRIFGGQV
jgi:hypothetical protein